VPAHGLPSIFDDGSTLVEQPLGIVARRPAGVLVGDHVLDLPPPRSRGGTWRFVSLETGAVHAIPSPVSYSAASTVGQLAEDLWVAGDAVVGHDGQSAVIVRAADGAVMRGSPSEQPERRTILGAERAGERLIVWWRLDATRTELEAFEVTTAERQWHRPGPSWAWDTVMGANAQHLALLADAELNFAEVAGGAPLARFDLRPFKDEPSWPHLFTMGAGGLIAAAPNGIVVVEPPTGRSRAIDSRLATGLHPSVLAADARVAFAVHGDVLVAYDLAVGARVWARGAARARSLHLTSRHLVLCDGDGGASVIDRATGSSLLRFWIGGCDRVHERADGSLAIAGGDGTWIVGPGTTTAREVVVRGTVTLDGVPTGGLPVLIGSVGYPLDGRDGCPPLPPYAQCVLSDHAGGFHATVRGLGKVPILVDGDVAARRAGKPRATVDADVVDLDGPASAVVDLSVRGADEEL
jgi:hypothetical protein